MYDTQSSSALNETSTTPTWVRILLGVVLLIAGVFVLGDVTFATIISTKLIGLAAIAAGAFEIVHAFWTKGWGGFVWQIVLGILYVALGTVLFSQPVAGALILTYVLGLTFLVSGFVRILLSFSQWKEGGWIMLVSGVFGVLAGLIVLSGFPRTTLWVLGLLLGIDLITHGFAWLSYAFMPRAQSSTST